MKFCYCIAYDCVLLFFGSYTKLLILLTCCPQLPEMNSSAESADGKQFGEVKTFLVQNAGLLVGFGIMLLLAVYGGEINFTD